jgi:hypothetical protein
MALHDLFDPKRRKEVRDAIQRGEDVFARKKGAVRKEAVEPITTEPKPVLIKGSKLPPVVMVPSNPPKFCIAVRTYDANGYLDLAIQYHDLRAAKEAVDNGADINHTSLSPVSPFCTDRQPTVLDFKHRTPLGYANELGNAEMIEFLKKHGATE